MDKYLDLYKKNKKLDDIFYNKYKDNDNKLYEKNCLELLVELGELANESKCFKYWSVKKPIKELVLEEYADCILMCLYFFNVYNIDTIELVNVDENNDILFTFNKLIRMCTFLIDRVNVNERLLKELFSYLMYIGNLLNLNENEIIDACYNKILKNEERLNSNY